MLSLGRALSIIGRNFPFLSTGSSLSAPSNECTFSGACQLLSILPPLSPGVCFSALVTRYLVSCASPNSVSQRLSTAYKCLVFYAIVREKEKRIPETVIFNCRVNYYFFILSQEGEFHAKSGHKHRQTTVTVAHKFKVSM